MMTERDTERRTDRGDTQKWRQERRRDPNPNAIPRSQQRTVCQGAVRQEPGETRGETQVVMKWWWASPSSAAPGLLDHPSSLRPLTRPLTRPSKEEGGMFSLKE